MIHNQNKGSEYIMLLYKSAAIKVHWSTHWYTYGGNTNHHHMSSKVEALKTYSHFPYFQHQIYLPDMAEGFLKLSFSRWCFYLHRSFSKLNYLTPQMVTFLVILFFLIHTFWVFLQWIPNAFIRRQKAKTNDILFVISTVTSKWPNMSK